MLRRAKPVDFNNYNVDNFISKKQFLVLENFGEQYLLIPFWHILIPPPCR